MKKVSFIMLMIVAMAVMLVGCGEDNPVQTCIISNSSYTTKDELEAVDQEEILAANESIYTTIHFIESPKGMEYTVKWYLDGNEIKSETKATQNDKQDIVIYELEAEQAAEGSLKIEVIYKDTLLYTKELTIQ